MTKRPSFQFYPGDWQSNTNLKRCSFEEKGVWVEILLLLHDSEEYGILRWTLEEIAQAVKCDLSIIKSLVKKGVLKGTDSQKEKVSFSPSFSKKNRPHEIVALIDAQTGALWYSSRMVRDEYIRQKRGEAGFKALNHPNVPKKRKDKDGEKVSLSPSYYVIDKDTFSPSPSSSSSSSKLKDIAQCANALTVDNPKNPFEIFWEHYPRKKDKGRAHVVWKKKNLDAIANKILADVKNRMAEDVTWQDQNFIPYPKTYLHGERWNDEIEKFENRSSRAEKNSYVSVENQTTSFREEPVVEKTPEQIEADQLAKERALNELRQKGLLSKKKMSDGGVNLH